MTRLCHQVLEARDAPDAALIDPEPIVARVVVPPWESTRCRSCGRLLCKNTRDALKPECVIEIKCGDCKTLNYLMGRPE